MRVAIETPYEDAFTSDSNDSEQAERWLPADSYGHRATVGQLMTGLGSGMHGAPLSPINESGRSQHLAPSHEATRQSVSHPVITPQAFTLGSEEAHFSSDSV